MWKKLNNNSIKNQVLLNLFFIYFFIIIGISSYFYFAELVKEKDIINSRKSELVNVISMNKMDLVSEIYLEQNTAIEKHLEKIKKDNSINGILLITRDKKYGDLFLDVEENQVKNQIFLTENLVYNNKKLGELKITAEIIVEADNLLIHKYGGHLIVFACSIIIISLCSIVILLRKKIILPIMKLSNQIKNINDVEKPSNIESTGFEELDIIVNEINKMKSRLISHINERNKVQKELEVSKIALQVAHDIRSPLTALDVAISSTNAVPEEGRVLIRNAVSRIRDISNDLVFKSKSIIMASTFTPSDTDKIEKRTIYLLSSLIDELVSEKRLYYRAKIGVEISANLGIESYGLFANIQAFEFKRTLSNLVNNAVEALSDNGKVTISLKANNEKIFILVKDSGKGIPEEILPKLMKRGSTFEKENGLGLGLYHAKSTIESWGGNINIASDVKKGTTVTIILKNEHSPYWFVPKLNITNGMTIVILDDDVSIHQIWQKRFNSLKFLDHRIRILHFSEYCELKKWHNNEKNTLNNAIYLFDYELIGEKVTGIDVIEKLALKKNCILVTSHYEEPEVLEKCLRLGVKLIPKPMAGIVPIELLKEESVKDDYVLIDNDIIILKTWEYAAKKNNTNIKTYLTYQDFFNDINQIDKETIIYIDSDLGNGIRGEEISKKIYETGFRKIYLATGYNKSKFSKLPWIEEIVGKHPPFQ